MTVEYRDADGRVRGVQARVIDFDKPTRGCQYAHVFIQRMGRTMKRQTLAALALVGALTLAGCMSAIYTPPQTPDHDDFRIIVNSGYATFHGSYNRSLAGPASSGSIAAAIWTPVAFPWLASDVGLVGFDDPTQQYLTLPCCHIGTNPLLHVPCRPLRKVQVTGKLVVPSLSQRYI